MSNTTVDPLIGRTISQYEIVARIGGGGMGVVYRAADLKLGRAVALKFLPPQWSHDEGAKQRFLREAQAASATNHRNICIIHDISHTDDGQLFIVMAHYEGQTLKQKLEAGPLAPAEALEIAAEVAEGLAKAHAQGVVHRDVKPGNLMVTDDGVKVLDFGLAKFADSLQLTVPGSTVGTVAYMSPEQARGEEADARSDVWALGVVLYEMLTGRVPFPGTYPEATFHAIKNDPVPAMSAPDREVPSAVETIVRRALEKDSGHRYQSARELARDLRLLQGRTIPLDLLTAPLPPLSHLRAPGVASWPRRIRRSVTPARAIAAVVAIASVAIGAYAWLTRPTVRTLVAIAPVANHTGEPELDAYRLALTTTLIDELSESPNIRVMPYSRLLEVIRRFISAGEMSTSEAVQTIAGQSGASFVVLPSLEYRDGTWLARVQIRDVVTGAVTSTYETDPTASTLPKETAHRQMPLLGALIQAHFKSNGPGRSYKDRPASARFTSLEAARAFEEGLNAYEQLEYSAALAAFQRAVSQDNQRAIAYAWLSRASLILKRRNDAVAAATRAKQLVPADASVMEASFIDGVLAESRSDFGATEQHYRRLAALTTDDPAPRTELADFLKRQYRNQEAIEAHHEVLRAEPASIRAHVELCQLYTRVPDYPLAEQHGQRALEKYRAAGNRSGEAQSLLCLGEVQRLQGNLDEGASRIRAARDIFESDGLPYGLARVYQYLGAIAAESGSYAAAVQLFGEALSRSRQVGNRELEGMELTNLGWAHEALGQRTQALDYYQQSHDLYQQIGEERRAADADINVASLLIDAGSNQSEALRRAANARATLRKQGSLEFEVIAMQVEAASHLYAGNHVEARRQFRTALSLAKERNLNGRAVLLSLKIAESHFVMSEYEAARAILEETALGVAGPSRPDIAVALGRVQTRLGDYEGARVRLEEALGAIKATGQLDLLPLVYLALGELDYEAGRPTEARRHFHAASALWTDELPDASAVEATCYQGSIDALAGKLAAGRDLAENGLRHAMKMGRLALDALCRLHRAQIELREKRYGEALALLGAIPADGERTIGPELRAKLQYLGSRLLAARGDHFGAAAEAARARKIMQGVQALVPTAYHDRFASRTEIRPILETAHNGQPR